MIRKFQRSDTDAVMQIWRDGNREAHSFIPAGYWDRMFPEVREQLSQAEVHVWEEGGAVRGFAGVTDGHIAGLFVERQSRSAGIGRELVLHLRKKYASLTCSVYRKNRRALSFYLREGFALRSAGLDEETGEEEYTLYWNRDSRPPDDWTRLYTAALTLRQERKVSAFIEAGQVAAALLTKSGSLYTGVCFDTACSLGMCAERSAVAHMLTAGENGIAKLAVVLPDNRLGLPCGACRELMMQLGEDVGEIEILTDYPKRETVALKELIPAWWGGGRAEAGQAPAESG